MSQVELQTWNRLLGVMWLLDSTTVQSMKTRSWSTIGPIAGMTCD